MAKPGADGVATPKNTKDAIDLAVKQALKAASLLLHAADLAEDGEEVGHIINAAIHLRDLANSLSPDRPDWPTNVIPFVPRLRG